MTVELNPKSLKTRTRILLLIFRADLAAETKARTALPKNKFYVYLKSSKLC